MGILCYWTEILKGSQDTDILCYWMLNGSQDSEICMLVDTE